MTITGATFIKRLCEYEYFEAKAVMNRTGAVFFPVTEQHRDIKAEGISYRDNYEGNALAAMVFPGRIEIRYHAKFDEKAVAGIASDLLSDSRLEFMRGWQVTYQGRPVAACSVLDKPGA